MNKPRKSWREKMANAKDLPKVFEMEGKDRKRLAMERASSRSAGGGGGE
jgi:hypothetical protein